MEGLITLGLAQILVGKAIPAGITETSGIGELTKIGKTYKDSCKMAQAAAEVVEHYEEGKSAPEVRKKHRKMPVLTFSMMNPDVAALTSYVGGKTIDLTGFGMDGSEIVENKAIKVETEQGLEIFIPNADIEAVINAEFSTKGIFLLDFTVTPLAVTGGNKPFICKPKPGK